MAEASLGDSRKCNGCKQFKPVSTENWKASFNASGLVIGTKCRRCSDREADRQRIKRAGSKNVHPANSIDDEADDSTEGTKKARGSGGADFDMSIFMDLSPLAPNDLSDLLSTMDDLNLFSVILETSGSTADTAKNRADEVSELIWDAIDYRFS